MTGYTSMLDGANGVRPIGTLAIVGEDAILQVTDVLEPRRRLVGEIAVRGVWLTDERPRVQTRHNWSLTFDGGPEWRFKASVEAVDLDDVELRLWRTGATAIL